MDTVFCLLCKCSLYSFPRLCSGANGIHGNDYSGMPRLLGTCLGQIRLAFRRQAAITGNKKRSQINPSLYSIYFTGCAQAQSRCELCMSVVHSTKQSVLAADPDPKLPARIKAVESAVVSLAEMCRLFNENRCRFLKCRYWHACAKCSESHTAVSCTQGTGLIPPPSVIPSRREASHPY